MLYDNGKSIRGKNGREEKDARGNMKYSMSMKLFFLSLLFIRRVAQLQLSYRVIHLSCRILLSFYSHIPRDIDLKLIKS